ncbi:MAG: xanthine dehydrogenase family protein subunit M [Phycisphaerae bacterium]
MIVPDIELHEATSLPQASALMARYGADARLLAGGTDLLVDLKAGRLAVRHVVSINRLDELRGVSATDSGMRIGALTTANQLAASQIVRDRFPAILDATRDMAAPQVRNMATVGGNIASAVPSADLPPILMAMKASVSLWSSSGERSMPLESFFLAPRQTVRKDDEVLTAILVPNPSDGFGAAYARFGLRQANACAVAGVAAGLQLNGEQTILARVVLCAVAPIPKLVAEAGAVLVGRRADETALDTAAAAAMKAAEPISDVRASADYRRELVGVLTRRALRTAWRRAREKRA